MILLPAAVALRHVRGVRPRGVPTWTMILMPLTCGPRLGVQGNVPSRLQWSMVPTCDGCWRTTVGCVARARERAPALESHSLAGPPPLPTSVVSCYMSHSDCFWQTSRGRFLTLRCRCLSREAATMCGGPARRLIREPVASAESRWCPPVHALRSRCDRALCTFAVIRSSCEFLLRMDGKESSRAASFSVAAIIVMASTSSK